MSAASLRRLAKAVAIYSLLVVPPVAGLLAILHFGEDLRPPPSIGGEWLLAGSAPACPPFDFGATPVTLGISQSGLRAVGKLSDAAHTALSLDIDGDSITGDQGGASGCRVAIAARLAAGAANSELVGVLRWPGCTGCVDRAFRASRAPRTGAAR